MKQVMVITGASSGLGAELAKTALLKGFSVVLIARRLDLLKALKQEIEREAGTVRIFKGDVTSKEEMQRIFEEIGKVDVLINNAGIGFFTWAHEAKKEQTNQMIDVNVKGMIFCSEIVMRQMMERKSGHIINIASQAGKLATPKSAVYAATKHAVLGYTNSIRMELAQFGVFVTAVNPGPIATPFFEQADPSGHYRKQTAKWMLNPEDVAGKIVSVIGRPVREVNLPKWMSIGAKFHSLFPSVVERLGRKGFFRK